MTGTKVYHSVNGERKVDAIVMSTEEITTLLTEGEEVYAYTLKESGEEKLLCIAKVKQDEDGRLFLNIGQPRIDSFEKIDDINKLILSFVRKGNSYKVITLADVDSQSRIVLREIKSIERVRLRRYVRVDTRMDYEVNECDVHGNPSMELAIDKHRTVNISGGGFLFYSAKSCTPGNRLFIKLNLVNAGIITTYGKVVRSNPDKSNPKVYSTAVEFVDILERLREKILSYVLHVQREQIKLGVFSESDQ